MRRSAAPSRKLVNSASPCNQETKISINESLIKTKKTVKNVLVTNATRKTSDVLSLLLTNQEENDENKLENANEMQITDKSSAKPSTNSEYDRVYSICWAKKSTKKHKTWEGDGFLFVKGDEATAKDTDGQFLGKLSKLKTVTFEDGQIISVGGKEIQIVEESTTEHQENVLKTQNVASPPRKKLCMKKSQISSVKYDLSGGKVVKKHQNLSKNAEFERFIFAAPSKEHQWEFNANKLPLTDVNIDPILCRVLRSHQIDGIVFLYKCVMGFWSSAHFGAILADEMGLGKTLQCITLTCTLLKCGPYGGVPVLKNVLIVTPSSLTCNWENEYLKWLGRERIKVFVVDSKQKPKDYVKMKGTTPIFIISYEMFIR